MRLLVGGLVLALLPSLAHADIDVNVDVGVQVDVSLGSPPPPPEPPVVLVQPTVVVNAGVAAAPGQVAVSYDAGPPARSAREVLTGNVLEAEVSMDAGSFGYEDIGGGQVGIRGLVGVQLGRVRLGLEGSVSKFSGSRDLYDSMGWWNGWEDLSGEIKRTGASARFLIGAVAPAEYPHVALGLYVEGGVGRQMISFDGGGSRTREDVMGGIGMEIGGGQHRTGAFDLGLRLQATESPSDDTHDVAVLFHLGAIFGT